MTFSAKNLPSRELTYPTWGSSENHLQKCQTVRDMLVPKRVSFIGTQHYGFRQSLKIHPTLGGPQILTESLQRWRKMARCKTETQQRFNGGVWWCLKGIGVLYREFPKLTLNETVPKSRASSSPRSFSLIDLIVRGPHFSTTDVIIFYICLAVREGEVWQGFTSGVSLHQPFQGLTMDPAWHLYASSIC